MDKLVLGIILGLGMALTVFLLIGWVASMIYVAEVYGAVAGTIYTVLMVCVPLGIVSALFFDG